MRILFFVLIAIAALPPAYAQTPATSIAKKIEKVPRAPLLSIDALCAKLTPAKVTAIMGPNFVRMPDRDKLYQRCTYGDSKEKKAMGVRYFSLSSSRLNAADWRKFVESDAKGNVIERDGVLVSHLRRNKFGTDIVWFKDREGNALELNVNSGVTEDKAVALAKAAMN